MTQPAPTPSSSRIGTGRQLLFLVLVFVLGLFLGVTLKELIVTAFSTALAALLALGGRK